MIDPILLFLNDLIEVLRSGLIIKPRAEFMIYLGLSEAICIILFVPKDFVVTPRFVMVYYLFKAWLGLLGELFLFPLEFERDFEVKEEEEEEGLRWLWS